MANQDKGSRFAELALELFGAQAADRFLREAWEAASPEAKRELADALVARIRVQVASDSHEIRYVVEARVRAAAKAALLPLFPDERIDRALKETFERLWPTMIESACRFALDVAISKVREDFWPKAPR